MEPTLCRSCGQFLNQPPWAAIAAKLVEHEGRLAALEANAGIGQPLPADLGDRLTEATEGVLHKEPK